MDYSQTIHDADDPAGASPWGNSPASSPARGPSHFDPITSEPPPFRYQTSNGLAQDHSINENEGFQRPNTATTASGTEEETEPSQSSDAPEAESAATTQPEAVEQQAPKSAPGQQQQHTEQEAQRGQEQQQAPRQTQPQFRLQAKITGLERTGKKDPILRFDVHVRSHRPAHTHYTDIPRPIFPDFALRSSEMSVDYTPSL